jgi:hypothetical protein
MSVRVNQPGHQPTLSHQVSRSDRIRGPSVPICVEIHRLGVGKSEPSDPQNRHDTTSPSGTDQIEGHQHDSQQPAPSAPAATYPGNTGLAKRSIRPRAHRGMTVHVIMSLVAEVTACTDGQGSPIFRQPRAGILA